MAEYFKFKIHYTPIIPYLSDFERRNNGTFLSSQKPLFVNFTENHIPFLKEDIFHKNIIFDDEGSERAIMFALLKDAPEVTHLCSCRWPLKSSHCVPAWTKIAVLGTIRIRLSKLIFGKITILIKLLSTVIYHYLSNSSSKIDPKKILIQ